MVPVVCRFLWVRIPNEDLIFGLRALGNDQDVCNLVKYTGANKVIQVYTEHGTTNLVTYFMSPNKRNGVVIEELNEEDEVAIEPKQRKQKLVHDPQQESCSSSLPLVVYGGESKSLSPEMRRTRNWKPREGTRSCSKRLYMETETGDNQDKEAPSSEIRDNQDKEAPSSEIRDNQDKEAPSSVTRDNQDKEVQQEHELDATIVHVPISLFEMLNVDFDPFEGLHDSENNNITDPTTIHLGSEYQDSDQDNRGLFDGQSNEFNSKKGEDDYSDDDSHVIVDIDNEVDDIDVDISDFRMNIDEGVEYSGFGFNNDVEDEQETDEEEDLEVIDCDGWESLGEDSHTEKNKRVLLKRLGKEKVCSHGEVHKSSFYVGQMWKSKKDLKNKVDEHALETRRNLAFKKNDATRLRAYCKGVV
uniref:Transposase MuDR plant domain-containing protein n=1 Tax=Lactuca sativa TaxID=4236 RepID=A0A9R1XEX2_LACSA|nr:hypothetical protein LSAT_V11C400202550 [Lactuca sativa]